jgi:hypothetical protein
MGVLKFARKWEREERAVPGLQFQSFPRPQVLNVVALRVPIWVEGNLQSGGR